MRKRWLCSLLVLAMLVNVTACADVKKEQKSQETESVEQESDRRGEGTFVVTVCKRGGFFRFVQAVWEIQICTIS